MKNANELFYNDIMVQLSDKLTANDLKIVLNEITVVLNKYDFTQRCTDVIVYEGIPQCIKAYLVTKKLEGLSDLTLKNYSQKLVFFVEKINKPITEITANDIRLFLFYYQKESSCCDRTLNLYRTILSTFFKWAAANEYVQTDPTITINKIKWSAKEREALSEIELESVRNACVKIRDRVMVEFFYSTGCRVSELINVKISDLNFSTGEVELFGKGSKYRKSYINSRCELALKEYLKTRQGDSEYLFLSVIKPYSPLTRRCVEKIIAELGVKAGLSKKLFPHLIRHTTATIGLQRGMSVTEIQKMLGHENVETTMIYAKTSDNSVKVGHKKCII